MVRFVGTHLECCARCMPFIGRWCVGFHRLRCRCLQRIRAICMPGWSESVSSYFHQQVIVQRPTRLPCGMRTMRTMSAHRCLIEVHGPESDQHRHAGTHHRTASAAGMGTSEPGHQQVIRIERGLPAVRGSSNSRKPGTCPESDQQAGKTGDRAAPSVVAARSPGSERNFTPEPELVGVGGEAVRIVARILCAQRIVLA